MGCNCKKVRKIQEALEVDKNVEETIFDKIRRYFLKTFYVLFAIFATLVLTPMVLGIIAYQFVAKEKMNITFPKTFMKILQSRQ